MIISTTELPPVTHTVKKPRTRINRRKAQWKKLVEQYEASELTPSAFCKEHKIANSSFLKWRRRFSNNNQSANDFVNITEPLTSAPLPEGQWQAELELGSGIVLRIRAS